MKRHLLEFINEFLRIQMNHMTFFAAGMLLLGLFHTEGPGLAYWVLFSFLPLYHYILRRNIKNVFLFIFLHLPAPVLTAVYPFGHLGYRVVFLLLSVIYAVWSMVVKVKSPEEEEEIFHPIFVFVLIGGTSILLDVVWSNVWYSYFLGAAIYYIACYFVQTFIERYQDFLIVNQFSASNIPEKEIFTVGLRQTGVYTLIGLVLIFCTANVEWMAYMLRMLGRGLLAVIRVLLNLLAGDAPDEIPPEETIVNNAKQEFGFGDAGEPFLIWKILEYIVMFAVTVGIVVAIIYGIYRFVRFILTNFRDKGVEKAAVQSGIDIREYVSIERDEKGAFPFFRFRDNREKVRKAYKKYILKEKKQIIGDLEAQALNIYTAKECCNKLALNTSPDKKALQYIYEKARYSEQEISAEDLSLLKTAVK